MAIAVQFRQFGQLGLKGMIAAMALPLAAMPLAAFAQDEGVQGGLLPPAPVAAEAAPAAPVPAETVPVIQPLPGTEAPVLVPLRKWDLKDAKALLKAIDAIAADGLDPADYQPNILRQAIAAGAGPALDEAAHKSFSWLVEDLRDGRTPMEARRQWFVVDPDTEAMPTAQLLDKALTGHDIAGVLASINPAHPDYARLKQELAATPKENKARRNLIRANMDRWRWLARDLGDQYLITNVPEFQLRLTVNDQIIRTYRTVVGKPGRTATPQLAEMVEGVVFNPTWTVPQSIVKGEGLGARVLNNPSWARAKGYKATRGENGYISVVQQPGPDNALGLAKLDMPNPHAIFLHDTPGKAAFERDGRALSHGCIRTERALEMAITMTLLGEGATVDEAVAISTSRKYTLVPFKKTIPVYITYFTMAQDIDGKLSSFPDLYERDAPVLESFAKARVQARAHVSDEEVVAIEAPGA